MPHFSNKKIIVLLVSTVFLVALIGFSLSNRHNATLPEQIIKDTVGFAQSVAAKPTGYITGIYSNIEALLNTYEENKRLKSRLENFVVLQSEVDGLKSENKKLRELIDKEDSLRDFQPIHATVIARNPDQWEEKIILNKGQVHGIEKNMAVMTAQGLVGKIIAVTPFTSEVELLYTKNANYRISALVQGGKKDIVGAIEGYDGERNELILKRINPSFEVEVGKQVVSSGLGGIFPKGILIGEVTEVTTEDFGLTKMAYVKPSADFSMLENVIVAKRDMTAIDGSDGDGTNVNLTDPPEEEEEE
ncbi:rod shape-determining protein MreC [Bacillus ndiopicus]|uniref:rod shape-determining protein MreC n=1 Tax=Bacillus ndiopicus TaxID=1347368 RepID=UPI0005A7DEBF|nr:rod shape-determining protein MreC [Bacillus ndiopicus]